ncbi:MAG: hypothetical protein LV473_10835 [Nitrospira sp.]|nr:hypothetical protein [Nitrospira sp.]
MGLPLRSHRSLPVFERSFYHDLGFTTCPKTGDNFNELHVQLHLAKADAKDEWARLESQWEEIKPKLEAAREEVGKTADSVGTALGLAIDELKKGYERLRSRL